MLLLRQGFVIDAELQGRSKAVSRFIDMARIKQTDAAIVEFGTAIHCDEVYVCFVWLFARSDG